MKNQKIYGVSEICAKAGIKPFRLNYLESCRYLSKPKKNFSGFRVYTEEDLENIIKIDRELREKRLRGAKKNETKPPKF